jgi:hypothetical protein
LAVDDETAYMADDVFCRVMAASYVGKRDLQRVTSRRSHIKNFQRRYLELVAALGEPLDETLRELQERSAVINHRHRLTGDSLVAIIEEIIALRGVSVPACRKHWMLLSIRKCCFERWLPVEPGQLLNLNTIKSSCW